MSFLMGRRPLKFPFEQACCINEKRIFIKLAILPGRGESFVDNNC